MTNRNIRQHLIVGRIKAGIVEPSRAVAAYIVARERNITQPNPALVKQAWESMTAEEQERMDALLMESAR